MPEEMIDVCNEENEVVDVLPKSKVHEEGLWHRVVSVFVCYRSGDQVEILLQKRALEKDLFPNTWAPVGGHVSKGETPTEAAVREAKEELNLQLKDEELVRIALVSVRSVIPEWGNREHRVFDYLLNSGQ